MTYNVFSGTLNPTQSINQSIASSVKGYVSDEDANWRVCMLFIYLFFLADFGNVLTFCTSCFILCVCVFVWPRAGSGALSKWVICACDSLVDFGTV